MAWMYNVDAYLQVRRAVMVDGMSIREASRVFGLHWDTVRKVLAFNAPYHHPTPGTKVLKSPSSIPAFRSDTMQNVHDYNYRLLPRTTVEKPAPGIAPEPPHDWTGWETRLRHSSMTEEERERRLTKLARLERAVRVHHIPPGYNPALERNDLGLRYLDMGDIPRAFRQLRGAVSQDPTMAMLHNNIGAMYLEIGDLERAGHYLSQAVLHQEDLDTAYGNRALVHIEQGQYLEAYQDLAVAIRLAPGDPAHHNNMGVLSLEAGFPETALACFISAIQLDPTSPMYHSNLGFAHRESGNPAEATRYFQSADRMAEEQLQEALRGSAT